MIDAFIIFQASVSSCQGSFQLLLGVGVSFFGKSGILADLSFSGTAQGAS
jgi:hypothetical protein